MFSKSLALTAAVKTSFHFYIIALFFTLNDLAPKVKENMKIPPIFLRSIVSFPALQSYWRYLAGLFSFYELLLYTHQKQGAERFDR